MSGGNSSCFDKSDVHSTLQSINITNLLLLLNKAKHPTWNSIKLQSVKKIGKPNSVKSLRYIKCSGFNSPTPINSLNSSKRYNCQNIYSWSRRPETYWKSDKKATILKVINKSIIDKFFKEFTNHITKTIRAIVFRHRSLLTFLNTGNTRTTDETFQ